MKNVNMTVTGYCKSKIVSALKQADEDATCSSSCAGHRFILSGSSQSRPRDHTNQMSQCSGLWGHCFPTVR